MAIARSASERLSLAGAVCFAIGTGMLVTAVIYDGGKGNLAYAFVAIAGSGLALSGLIFMVTSLWNK